eukprot:m.174318 g.174318  ORF g.174318 m.174318 type:complete len:66 (-) comp13504_c1_seq5:650-847(-)
MFEKQQQQQQRKQHTPPKSGVGGEFGVNGACDIKSLINYQNQCLYVLESRSPSFFVPSFFPSYFL